VFDDMLAARRGAFAQRLPLTQARRSEIAITPLRNTQAELTALVERAAMQADGAALANTGELALAARITRVQAGLAALTPSSETMSTVENVAMQERKPHRSALANPARPSSRGNGTATSTASR
jgi:hypothetical protein